jgi:hypothetical protein
MGGAMSTPTPPAGNIFDQMAAGTAPPASPATAPAAPAGGNIFDQLAAGKDPEAAASVPDPNQPDAEEQAFLQAHPDHKWMPPDEKFPNRPAGIYPTGRGNEWRNDPTYAQAPVDLHLGEHTSEGAAEGAAAVAPVLAPEILSAGITALKPALLKGIQGMGEWAVAHPVAAKMIYEGLKSAAKGAGFYVAAQGARRVIDASH